MENLESQRLAEKLSRGADTLWQKTKTFFVRNAALFCSAVVVFLLYLVGLFINGVYPFGHTYTAASYDLSAQICPFIEHLFDVMDGKSSLTYSYAIAGGADVTGTFLYFFLSPFSFIFLLLGDGFVAEASSFVMAFKLAAIAGTGTWFAKKLFQGIPNYLCVCVGIVYSYCGYMFVSNTYINWMDFLIYAPICVWAFRRFVQTGSFWRFSVVMSCCIYTCFSIACFSMWTVFPALVGYAFFCVEKDKRKAFVSRLCWAFVVAILLSLPVLFPALAAYMRSGRSGGLFDNMWTGISFKDGVIGGVIEGFTSNSSGDIYAINTETALYRKFSYIFSDSVFFAFTIVWLIKEDWDKPFVKFMLLAGVFTMLPVLVDEVMLLMNMGSYMSYALRFGFLNALYMLGGACLCMEKVCYKFNRAHDGTLLSSIRLYTGEKVYLLDIPTQKGNADKTNNTPAYRNSTASHPSLLWPIAAIVLGICAIAFICWYTYDDKYKDIWTKILSTSELVDGLKWFSSRFAHSLGGLEVVGFICIAVALVTLIGLAFVYFKKISVKLLSFVLIAVVGVQVVFYNNELALGNRSTQHTTLQTYEALCEKLNERDDSYFRVKDYGDKVTANAPFTGNSNAYSVFSSVIDKDNFAAGELFGYDGNMKNSLKSSYNPKKYKYSVELGDAFMGYKYFFVSSGDRSKMESGSLSKYMKPVADEKGNYIQKNGYYIYENTLVFPLAYRLESGEFRFVKPNESNSSYRAENQRAFYKFLSGETLAETCKKLGLTTNYYKDNDYDKYAKPETVKYLQEYLQSRAASQVDVGAGKITVKISAEKDGEALFMNFVASKGYTAYVNGKKAEFIDNDLHFISVALEEGENVVEFIYSSPYVKYAGLGVVVGALGLVAVWFVFKKTNFTDVIAPVIYWTAAILTVGIVAFFMIYPTSVCIIKLIHYWIL